MKNKFQEIYDACLQPNGKFDYERFEKECAEYFDSLGPGVAHAGHQIMGELGRFLNAKTHKEPLNETVIQSIRAVAAAAKAKAPQAKSLIEEIEKLQKRVEALEVDVTAANGMVGALEEQIRTQKTDFEGRVADAEQRAANSRTQVSTATRIARNQIGKRDEELERVIADYADDSIAHAERIAGLEDDLSSTRELNSGLVAENAAKGKTNRQLADLARVRGKRQKFLGITSAVLLTALIGTGIGMGAVNANLKKTNAKLEDTVASQSETIDEQSGTITSQEQTIDNQKKAMKKLLEEIQKLDGIKTALENENKGLKADLASSIAGQEVVRALRGILTDEQKAAVVNEDGSVNVAALLAIDEEGGYKGVLADVASAYAQHKVQIDKMEDVFISAINGLGLYTIDENGERVPADSDTFFTDSGWGYIDTERLQAAFDACYNDLKVQVNALLAERMMMGALPDGELQTVVDHIDALFASYRTLLGDYDEAVKKIGELEDEIIVLRDRIVVNENGNTVSQATSGSGASQTATPSGSSTEDEENKIGLGDNSSIGGGMFGDDESAK